MPTILAIDPGHTHSAIVQWDGQKVWVKAILENNEVLRKLRSMPSIHTLAIEEVRSYGMAVGIEVFQTVRWSGRFEEAWSARSGEVIWCPRINVKTHLCHDSRARDGNIIQALVDRFAPGEKNRGKGKKAAPGFFHGFHNDIWQAFALAVTIYDHLAVQEKTA